MGGGLDVALSRARETCELAGLGERARARDELLEWDYGDYEGITTAEIRETRPHWFLWRDGCPDGEGAFDVGRRVDALVDELSGLSGDAVLFSHGHVLRVLAARWIGLPRARRRPPRALDRRRLRAWLGARGAGHLALEQLGPSTRCRVLCTAEA